MTPDWIDLHYAAIARFTSILACSGVRYEGAGDAAFGRLRRCSKPTIAVVRGYCLGGGVALASLCDLRIAEAGAVFSISAARMGLGYSFFGTERLVGLIGVTAAKEMLFTALRYDAEEALRLELVSRVFSREGFEEAQTGYLLTLAEAAPLTLRAAKMAIEAATLPAAERDMAPVEAAIAACGGSEDFREGQRAFTEKRSPRFHGR